MFIKRPADQRGKANFGWLDTRYTFSFADYYDPNHMGFRALRVINEDVVKSGNGFPMHPHRNMEIVTYVIRGQLEHKDSMGNHGIINAGKCSASRPVKAFFIASSTLRPQKMCTFIRSG